MLRKPFFILILPMALGLSGCGGFSQALGTAKTAPDEFEVVVRPALTLPPAFSLDEVRGLGEARPPSDAVSLSDALLTGGERSRASGFDAVFGTEARLSGIRDLVDEETLGARTDTLLPWQSLFGGERNVGLPLSVEEARRIRDARARGEDLTATPTIAIDPEEGEVIPIQ